MCEGSRRTSRWRALVEPSKGVGNTEQRTDMKTMYVYILECSDKSYYIGVSNNAEKRFLEHSTGINRNCYTFTRRPLKLVFSQIFSDPDSAIAFEKKIKGWTRAKKKALIEDKWESLPELSKSSAKKAIANASTGSA
jgi:putative endonuclease